ncbi:MAG: hypothetical protein ACI8ZM_004931 [Crocinitomix sp.]|jgi:hypothetical protein
MKKKIKDLEFHDSGLERIDIDFDTKCIKFEIEVYNEEKDDYFYYRLTCKNSFDFEIIDKLPIIDYSAVIKDLTINQIVGGGEELAMNVSTDENGYVEIRLKSEGILMEEIRSSENPTDK